MVKFILLVKKGKKQEVVFCLCMLSAGNVPCLLAAVLRCPGKNIPIDNPFWDHIIQYLNFTRKRSIYFKF